MRSKADKRWLGDLPVTCDICCKEVTKGHFVDGRTKMGPWGLMCMGCHSIRGVGLGTGRGQKYDAKTGLKVGG